MYVGSHTEEFADVAIIKQVDKNAVRIGDIIKYTITITNYGPGRAHEVVLSDTLPRGMHGPAYSDDLGLSWREWPGRLELSSMAPGSTVVMLRATLGETSSTSIANIATIRSSTPDPNPQNNSDSVTIIICS